MTTNRKDRAARTTPLLLWSLSSLALLAAVSGVGIAPASANQTPTSIVEVAPGEDLAALVATHPPGTEFVLLEGTHLGVSVTPKSGDTFRGEGEAILDGEEALEYAFSAHDEGQPVVGVSISGLIIRNYATPVSQGTVGGGGAFDWIIQGNEISHSTGGGVGVNDGMIVRGNYIHHNQQIGLIAGSPSSNILVEGNEISYNNIDDVYDMAWEAGGTKFVTTDNLTVRSNYVHNNHGAGLWTDNVFENTQFVANLVVDNYGPGIHHEISGSALIENNVVVGNANNYYLGGILIAASGPVDVASNHLSGNYGGVVIVQEDREEFLAEGIIVHNNFIAYSDGVSGVLDQVGDGRVFERGMSFENNQYEIPEDYSGFAWRAGDISFADWTSLGMDS